MKFSRFCGVMERNQCSQSRLQVEVIELSSNPNAQSIERTVKKGNSVSVITRHVLTGQLPPATTPGSWTTIV